MPTKAVYVLGAGFTRAFVPTAPLIEDDYGVAELLERFKSFPTANAVLRNATRGLLGARRVNLEKLMTRLTGMPYDDADARHELSILAMELRRSLIRRIEEAKAAGIDWDGVHAFAKRASAEQASIITFNYDDLIDEALYNVNQPAHPLFDPGAWHPDGGYGFSCRPSVATVADQPMWMNDCSTLLLKLHGSLNWRSAIGEPLPRAPSGLLHHETWPKLLEELNRMQPKVPGTVMAQREQYLEPDPLIVPPVLVKSELSAHPVLRVVWERARSKLLEAESVAFVGYSLPVTDLASRALFDETLVNRPEVCIQVVSKAHGARRTQTVMRAYRSLFGRGRPIDFDFSGAADWIGRLTSAKVASVGT
jgi:hypothetical protein